VRLGPQFDQPTLPGMGRGGGEQMTMFRTKELSDGTMRGTYNTADHASDWVESATREKVTPSDVSPAPERAKVGPGGTTMMRGQSRWSAPSNDFEFGETSDPSQWSDTALARYENNKESPTDLVEGGRAHLSSIKETDEQGFMADFSEGTDFGDNRLRAKPYDFRELEFNDENRSGWSGGLYSAWTPEGEQVAGMEYEESGELPNAQVIGGAGSGSAFRGKGYGTMTAARMAAERNDEGIVMHGNSFTEDGKGAFQSKGAKSESQIREDVNYRAGNDPDVIEMATEAYDTPALAREAGFSAPGDFDEDTSAINSLLGVSPTSFSYDEDSDIVTTGAGDTLSREDLGRMAARGSSWDRAYVAIEARQYARDLVHGDMLEEQGKTIDPLRPYLGVPDRARSRQPTQPSLLESDPAPRRAPRRSINDVGDVW